MNWHTLDVTISGAVATVTLNRPRMHNAFNETAIKELEHSFAARRSRRSSGHRVNRGRHNVLRRGRSQLDEAHGGHPLRRELRGCLSIGYDVTQHRPLSEAGHRPRSRRRLRRWARAHRRRRYRDCQ